MKKSLFSDEQIAYALLEFVKETVQSKSNPPFPLEGETKPGGRSVLA